MLARTLAALAMLASLGCTGLCRQSCESQRRDCHARYPDDLVACTRGYEDCLNGCSSETAPLEERDR